MPQEPSAAAIYGRDFPAGAVVFEEGHPGGREHAIVSGEALGPPRDEGHRDATALRDLADEVEPSRRFDSEEKPR